MGGLRMERELDNQFMLKEDHYFSEKRLLENQLAQVMEEKRFFLRYLEQLSLQVQRSTPYYDVEPNRQIVYRLLMNSREEAEQRVKKEQVAIDHQLEAIKRVFYQERQHYEEMKRRARR